MMEHDHDLRRMKNPQWTPKGFYVAVRNVLSGKVPAVIMDECYLLLYDVGPTWCSDELHLFEQLLIRLPTNTPTDFSRVVRGMRSLAKQRQCTRIVCGNGVMRPGLRRMYEREGFRVLNEAYILEV
ncbi:hypothetical protein HOR51_gp36 [Ralstonia phage phiAp1]|uniref:Uncharacterized protein n=1 Tax=Ralstonia phage phiAp1 TaxID=2783867 RepID=A0A1L7DS52_9CAUD|nr:hypothetical protein HOR51_gp36 [Ralstonia phage phiAp1]APU03177.1 hypothetical protein phiAp1_36 [Ralstonia phage phiAp1]